MTACPREKSSTKALAVPILDSDGRIVGGTLSGMTPAEVQADKAAFERSDWAKIIFGKDGAK